MNDRRDERWAVQAQARPDFCRALVEKILDVAAVVDRGGIVRFINPAVEQVLGYSPDDLSGTNLFELLHPSDAASARARLMQPAAGHDNGTAELRLRHKDGSWRTLEAIGRTLGDDADSPGIVISTRDVTCQKQVLEDHRRSHEFVERIAATVPDGLVIYNIVEGRFVYANREVAGYSPERIRGLNREQFAKLVHPDDKPVLVERLRKFSCARDGEVLEAEYRIRDREGRWRWLRSRDTIFTRTGDGAPEQIIGAVTDITSRKQADSALEAHEAELRTSREELRALTARLLTTAEEERKALSRELHDDLNQRLAILAIDLETIAVKLSPVHPLRSEIEMLKGRLAELSEDVRRIAYQLRPSILDDLGLVPALRSLCEQLKVRERVAVAFTHARVPERVPPELALCLYRVAQEALHNVARHAKTRRAAVTLAGLEEAIVLTVRDWGAGFDPGGPQRKGLGIVGMEERVRLAGGSFDLRSRPGHGAEIEVTIPLAAEGR
jgi:PAS domain S-box-containing protein